MITIMHMAAQYLATAAISFIEKKEDDSHTNLGWTDHSLETHPFPNGDSLRLNYENFSLEWQHQNGNKEHLLLNHKTHKEIVEWISEMSQGNGINKPYSYNLHYELPYPKISDLTTFNLTSQDRLNDLINHRDLAHQVITHVLKTGGYESSVRIWPHHFDTGAFFTTHDNLGNGLGMAIPDSLIDDFYLYVSGYKGHDIVELPSDTNLEKGTYYSNGWKGFALPVTGITEDEATRFFTNAINQYT
ncbi:MAG: hypothetical protein AAFX55_02465 [Bacteroidota bacterium]